MKYSKLLLITVLGSFILSGFAFAKTRVFIQPQVLYNYGKTDYTLKITDGSSYYKSRLEFPTDAALIGQAIGLAVYDSAGRTWQYKLTGYTNLNDRSGTMTDSDWFGNSFSSMTLFSYTESNVKKRHVIWEGEITRRMKVFKKAALEFFIGYRYQRMSTDIYDLEGWQLDITDPNLTRYTVDMAGHFLYYRVTYNFPFAGADYRLKLGPQWNLGLRGAFGPVFASDYDNHFSRNKASTGSGTGMGGVARTTFDFSPDNNNRFGVSLYGEFNYYYVPAKQRQEWYGDDPASEGDETGTVISNINYQFKSWQFNFGIKLGILL